jgi:hypothetical protein
MPAGSPIVILSSVSRVLLLLQNKDSKSYDSLGRTKKQPMSSTYKKAMTDTGESKAGASNKKRKRSDPFFVAFDVEKKGARFEHPVIQVGVAYGSCLNDIQTASFCFDYKDVPFEKRCWDEFWSNWKDVLARIEKAAEAPNVQWPKFGKFLDALEAEHDEIEIVSDNPAYDIEAIDHHLDKDLGRAGVRYTSTMGYRYVNDCGDMGKGLPRAIREAIKAKTNSMARHTHWAEDDAMCILVKFLLTRHVISILRDAEDRIADVLKL